MADGSTASLDQWGRAVDVGAGEYRPGMAWKGAFVLTLGALLTVMACSSRLDQDSLNKPVARVTKVVDGDTLHVLYRGREDRVRLIGVDTPEVPWFGGRGQCFGPEAARYTASRLGGRVIWLQFDLQFRDRYGRILAYVYLGQELFNLTLVRMGYADADPVPPNMRMAATFAAAEATARASDLGRWSACW